MQAIPKFVIIVAAGSGKRFGGDIPKQFLDLDGKPVCVRAALCFLREDPSVKIIFALPAADFGHWRDFVATAMPQETDVRYVQGGDTRWASVKNALASIGDEAPARSAVMIHDGARPLVDGSIIRNVCGAILNTDGAIPAVAVTDSLRQLEDDGVTSRPVDRSLFRAVQTPQAFALWRLREAYKLPYQDDFTDDASVMAAAGFTNVVLVPGKCNNIKITTPEDLKIARCLSDFSE